LSLKTVARGFLSLIRFLSSRAVGCAIPVRCSSPLFIVSTAYIAISLFIRLLRRMLYGNDHLYLILLASNFSDLLRISIAMRLIIETVSSFSPGQLYSFALSRCDRSRLIKRRREPFFQIATAVRFNAGPVKGTFMTSTPRNSPLRALPSIVIENLNRFCGFHPFLFSNRARPLRRLSAPYLFRACPLP
jgi:hypothetical protein